MFWSTAVMTVGHLLFSVVYTLYVVAAVFILEEPQLDAEHGGMVWRGCRSSVIPICNLGAERRSADSYIHLRHFM
jgi:hypothetical protein